jgi:predicted DNA-binding protein with PD1-like motif
MKLFVTRLSPDTDLRPAIDQYVESQGITAGVIVSAVGSLSRARLRLAGAKSELVREEKFEIVSITGTVGAGGSHIHVSLSDSKGEVIGGHLKDAGCIISTTVELAILADPTQKFARTPDLFTGFDELEIQ